MKILSAALLMVLGTLLASCNHTDSNAGGGAHAAGDGSIAIGGPSGPGNQFVNISNRPPLTPNQKERLVNYWSHIVEAFHDYNSDLSERSVHGMELQHHRAAHFMYGMPEEYRRAHHGYLQTIEKYRAFFAANPHYEGWGASGKPSEEAHRHDRDFRYAYQELSSVIDDLGLGKETLRIYREIREREEKKQSEDSDDVDEIGDGTEGE